MGHGEQCRFGPVGTKKVSTGGQAVVIFSRRHGDPRIPRHCDAEVTVGIEVRHHGVQVFLLDRVIHGTANFSEFQAKLARASEAK